MKTLQTALDVVEKNFAEHNMGLADAYKEGAAAIRAHVGAARREIVARLQKDTPGARLSPEAENYFKVLEFNLGSKFKERLMPTGAHKLEVAEHGEGKQYTVTVST
ncbi:MAG: hypothetical protein PHI16_06710 [Methanocellales archaeon]|nr:hypothetical protein [Methanocellales archaeon]